MKYWASLSKAIANKNNSFSSLQHSLPLDLPSHERDKILKNPNAPKLTYCMKMLIVIVMLTSVFQAKSDFSNRKSIYCSLAS
ncbi:hypothetical protein RYX36_017247 [Vicia faba]